MRNRKGRYCLTLLLAALLVPGWALLPAAAPTQKDLAAGAEDAALYGASAGEVSDVTATAHGDVNDDGITDLVIMHGDGSDFSGPMGKAYVYFGRDGIAGDVDLGAAADLTIEGRDYCGGFWSLACGDHNGDGYDDVILGAPYDSDLGMYAGTVNVVYGRDDYSGLPTPYHWNFSPTTPPDATLSSGISNEFNGMSVACADFNGDNYDDVAWGAPAGNGGVHYYDGSGWSTQWGGNGETLNAVCMFSASSGWAVGDYVGGNAQMTIERFNGTRWMIPASVADRRVDLYGVHGNASNSLWVVGEAGTILYYNGSAWADQDGGVASDLNAVYALAAGDVYAVGEGGVILHYDGTAWSAQSSGVTSDLNAVYALAADDVRAVGDGGVILHNKGSGWSSQDSGTTANLNGVWASAANSAWAVGASGTIRYYDGSDWTGQSGGVAGSDLKGITGTAAGDVWACGANGALTHFDGTVWAASPQSFTNRLNALDCISASAVWQVGDAYTGRAYVSFGQASPPAYPAPDVTANGIDTFDYAGRPLATGRYDNDAYNDLLIGANIADGPGNARVDAGEAYVLRGRSAWPSVIDLEGGAATTIYGADAFDQFPEYAQNPSPAFDADAYADLLLGTRFADGPGNLRNSCGETCVIYGGALPSILDLASRPADVTFYGGAPDQEYGYGASAFDFNRDGLTDVFVSTVKLGMPPARSVNGVVNMVNGRAAWPAQVDLGTATDMYVYGAQDQDMAGLYLSGANIHNSDPGDYQDLVISSRASGPGGIRLNCGEHYVFLGYDNVPPTCEITDLTDGQVLTGQVGVDVDAYDYFGVTRVEFYLDGVLQHTDDTAPYHWDFETLGREDGRDKIIEAVAYDPHGNTGRDARKVRILNALPTLSQEWYLAEGSTAWGFEEWVLIQNPGTAAVTAQATFMREDGSEVATGFLPLPPTSRLSVNVAEYVGEADVSTRVESGGGPVICERAMYWNDRAEGHDSIGTTTPSPSWYLAEGSTAWGFEEWVLVQNPNPDPAEVQVAFMRTDGTVVEIDPPLVLPPTSRRSINVADYVGQADVSAQVEADLPVIVERAMYRYGRQIGHDTVGTPALSSTWYLAEGTTAWGFDEWVLVQNPGAAPATVAVEFMKADGTVVPYGVVLAPLSRYSIHVNEVPGCASADLSTFLSSDQPIIAERAMYWNGAAKPAGHVTLGTPSPMPRWYLAEGTTAWGFETFILVQNPNDAPCAVTLTFMRPDGSSVSPVYTVPANARLTVKVNDVVGDSDVSTLVSGSLPVIAERAMYWGGRDGGHCTVGAWGQ